ncbi:Carbamate kinase [Photobacterium marinum]|uniref:Carbamate kinase n=1 Tax=Photobacterium marinum TaxID=1056511 RepID=L8J8N0_9GAMM|nr:carbamate kinase [Photobacterium marinum]ELR63797.1 Carbamate kinase [Photobacterium marinum]
MKNDKPILVVAVGGNALLQRGETMSHGNQAKNIAIAADALAKLNQDYRVVIVHGNGPQVGLLALQNLAYTDTPPYPLDILGAETQGMIGYMMTQSLRRSLPNTEISTILTQVAVDSNDPAFNDPNKFIGPVYDKATAELMADKYNWSIKPDGEYWRRVVPSPQPQAILEINSIKTLLEQDHMVICCGGGGCPVVDGENGCQGVEAVIDKDLSAAVLATQLGAEHFLILTDGDYVCVDWGTPNEKPLHDVSVDEITQYQFAAGSMAPKVDACCTFAKATNGTSHIGSLHKTAEIMSHNSGTHISIE